MKTERSHYQGETDDSLGSVLDRCGRFYSHRIGNTHRGQESVLVLIAKNPGITQKELSEQLGIQPASVSETITKLDRKGFIEREKDEADRRIVRVNLTAKGKDVLESRESCHEDIFKALTPDEQEQLKRLLCRLLEDWKIRYTSDRHRRKKDQKISEVDKQKEKQED